MKKPVYFLIALFIAALSAGNSAKAQQYKLRQANTMMGMKTESTVYVKGMRKRTESPGMMGMGSNQVTIEQCDLQRTIKINDKKKLYYIEPFAKETEEIIDEDVNPPAVEKNKPATSNPKEKNTQAGGIIYSWYTITDTGERKKMYGFTARHVWTYRKMKPSPDACMMKDSMVMKTDGWYIDLPEFNCPIQSRPQKPPMRSTNEKTQPDCKDRFVSRRKGKGKLGFPLSETKTMMMGNGSEFETSVETLEFITGKLDSMLFEIPPGYKEAKSEDELQDKFDMAEMMKQANNNNQDKAKEKINPGEQKKTGMIRIGVYEPKSDGQLQDPALQQHMVNTITAGNIEAVAITSEDDARKYNCDYTLATGFSKIKQASKVGGLLKAIKNTDPNAASSYNIEAALTLVKLSDGSTRLQQKVDGKYEGKIDDAAQKAMDEGCR
ncbi:MAG: hypothetical protein EPN92_06150, partial [Chitinophagaceae bacterium]